MSGNPLAGASWELLAQLFPEMVNLGYTAILVGDELRGLRPDGTVWLTVAKKDQGDAGKFDELIAALRRAGMLGH